MGDDYATALATIRAQVDALLAELDALDEAHALVIAAADAADTENPAYHAALASLLWAVTELPGLADAMGGVAADIRRAMDRQPVILGLSRDNREHVITAAQSVVAAILFARWLPRADQQALRSAWQSGTADRASP